LTCLAGKHLTGDAVNCAVSKNASLVALDNNACSVFTERPGLMP